MLLKKKKKEKKKRTVVGTNNLMFVLVDDVTLIYYIVHNVCKALLLFRLYIYPEALSQPQSEFINYMYDKLLPFPNNVYFLVYVSTPV